MSNVQTYWRKGWKVGEGTRRIHRHRQQMEHAERAFGKYSGGWDLPASTVRKLESALDFGVLSAYSTASDHVELKIAQELARSFNWPVPHTTSETDVFYTKFVDELAILNEREQNTSLITEATTKVRWAVQSITAIVFNAVFLLGTGVGGLFYNSALAKATDPFSSMHRNAEKLITLSGLVAIGGLVLAFFAGKWIREWSRAKSTLAKLETEVKAQEQILPTISLTREQLDCATVNNPNDDSLSRSLHLWVRSGILRLHLYEREGPKA